jgi:hypothetical protein
MDTSTETGEADPTADGKILRFRGEHHDPRTGKPAKFIWQLSRDGDEKISIEMFDIDADGKEKKVMSLRGSKSVMIPPGRVATPPKPKGKGDGPPH